MVCALAGAWLLVLAPAARAEEPATLPDALPPLDDATLADTADPLRFFAAAHLRAELENARGFSRSDPAGVGAGVGAQAGVEAQLGNAETGGARLVVVFAEAGRLGQPTGSPQLVARPPLAPLQQVEIALQTTLFGLPAELSVGRAPVTLADGRMLGEEPFDLRGRALDGARARLRAEDVDVGLGAWWLAGFGDALDVVAAFDSALHVGDAVDLEGWMLAQRAGASGLLVPTLGSRVVGRLWMLEGRAAAEMQAPHVAATLEREGLAGRLTAGGRATLDSDALGVALPRAFVDLDADLVAGDATLGRVLHAPAPTLHGARGELDLLAPDNTWRTALALGLREDRLSGSITGVLVGVVDRAGPLLDALGNGVPARRPEGAGLALYEVDLALQAQLSPELSLGLSWGLAAPGPALVGQVPAQRLLIELRASTQGP